MFKKGDVVKYPGPQGADFGIVVSPKDENGIMVIRVKLGEEAAHNVDFWPSMQTQMTLAKEGEYDKFYLNDKLDSVTAVRIEKDDLTNITALNDTDKSIIDNINVALGGDKFIPAFAGYTKDGYHKNNTSIMKCSPEERIAENPELGMLDEQGYAFEPTITESLQFHNVAKRINESINFPAGVIPIFGTTGSGKSTLAYFLAKTLKAEFIRFGEPEIPSIHSPQDVMAGCQVFLNNEESKFLVIDSFRPFMFLDTEKASMGKGGINNALYMDFTALSSLATWAGKTIFIVINPLAFNKDDIETVRSNLESSTIGLLHTTEYGHFTFVSRTKSNNRIPVLYSTDYNVNSSQNEEEKEVEITNDLVIGKLDYKSGVWNKILNKF